MSEIQSIASAELIKYIISGYAFFVGLVNALMIYIFRMVKKDIEDIKKLQKIDHDKINKIHAEHDVFHNQNGNKKD